MVPVDNLTHHNIWSTILTLAFHPVVEQLRGYHQLAYTSEFCHLPSWKLETETHLPEEKITLKHWNKVIVCCDHCVR